MTKVKEELRGGTCIDDRTSNPPPNHYLTQFCESGGNDRMNDNDAHVQYSIKTSDVRNSPHPMRELQADGLKQHEQNAALGTTSLIPRDGSAVDGVTKMEKPNDPSSPAIFKSSEDVFDPSQSNGEHVHHIDVVISESWRKKDFYEAQEPAEFLLPTGDNMCDDFSTADATASIIGSEGPRIQAFAKLEFDDGQFYMNTHAVELGRDIRAARIALQQDLRSRQFHNGHGSSQSKGRSNSSADGTQGGRRLKSNERKPTASSVMSETGGILNYDDYGAATHRRPRSRGAKSESSIQLNLSQQKSKLNFSNLGARLVPNGLSKRDSSDGAQPVNPQALMPSPDECPLIPIHPPVAADGTKSGHGGISRRHVRIAYNFERRSFEMEVKGRNGAFVDDQFYGPGELADLTNNCLIQIGNIGIRFILPKVTRGDSSFEGTQVSEAQSAMSFEFEDGRGESINVTNPSESDSSDLEDRVNGSSRDTSRSGSTDNDSSIEGLELTKYGTEAQDPEDSRGGQQKLSAGSSRFARKASKTNKTRSIQKNRIKPKGKANSTINERDRAREALKDPSQPLQIGQQEIEALNLGIPPEMIPPRRKGPGRPPKNGFMSKREEAALKKQIKQMKEVAKAQALANGDSACEVVKAAQDGANTEKRKYTKRKKIDGQPDEADVQESIEGPDPPGLLANPALTSSRPPKEKKPKPPRSPSPFIDEASLTPEQLAKPQQSYVVLIHEALTNCPAGQMSLPQIYKAIERRYPHFKFKVSTLGWQSSIRHNLLQHAAFRKIERDGKGWMWGLVPEVSIEKEKRARRPSPPPLPQGRYYSTAPTMIPSSYTYSPRVDGPPQSHGPIMYHPVPINAFGATPTVRTHSGLALPLPQTDSASTYQSPYTPAPQSKKPPEEQRVNEVLNATSEQPSNPSSAITGAQASHNAELAQSQPAVGRYLTRPSGSPQAAATNHSKATLSQFKVYGGLSKSILDAIERFKSIMINKELAGMEHAEDIVNRAVKRVLGIQLPDPTQPEYPGETDIMKVLQNMLDQRLETERLEREQNAGATAVQARTDAANHSNEQQSVQTTVEPQHEALSQSANCIGASFGSSDATEVIAPVTDSQDMQQVPQMSALREPTSVPNTLTLVSTTPAKPIPPESPAEKDQVLSILKQLGQAPASKGVHTEHSSVTSSAPLRISANSTPESTDLLLVQGTKRKLSSIQDGCEHQESDSHEYKAKTRAVDMEDNRPKRVTV